MANLNGTLRLILIVVSLVVTLGVIIVGAVYTYSQFTGDIVATKTILSAHRVLDTERDKILELRVRELEKAVIRIQVGAEHAKSDQQQELYREILEEIRSAP
jgi:hypothetical protein